MIKGEAIRVLRLSSDKDTYLKTCKYLAKKFRERNYPHKLVRNTFQQVAFSLRNKYLEGREQTQTQSDAQPHTPRIPFICTYQAQMQLKQLRIQKSSLRNPSLLTKKPKPLETNSLVGRTAKPELHHITKKTIRHHINLLDTNQKIFLTNI